MAFSFGLSRLFSRTSDKPEVRHVEAAYGGRRGASGPRHFGSHGPETLAAGATVRSRARHAYANNGYIRNAVNAWVAEAVGAGIEANSAHPDKDVAAQIDQAFFTADLDAEGRTDFRGMTAAAVLAEIVDGEAFFVAEHRQGGTVWRQIPAEFVDESDARELGDGYVVAGIEFAKMARGGLTISVRNARRTFTRSRRSQSAFRLRTFCTFSASLVPAKCAACLSLHRSC